MKKCLFILLMLVFTTFAGFAQTMRGYEYWFDNDYAGRTTTISSQQQLSLSLDIESINPGLHYLNFRAQGSDGKWGCLSRYIVYVNNHANHLSRVDYWLDSKIDGKKSQGVNGNSVLISVDISQMERGKHTLAFQGFTERGSFAMLDSLEFDAIDAPIAPMPVISYEGNVISISIADPTATTLPVFYYTLDGTDPDTTSTKYEGPFEVTHNCVVKSVSYLEGAKNSPVDSLVVNWFKCEKPVVTWNGEQLSISTETEGADIYYSVKEYESSPTGSGTEADPYNVAAAIAKCKEVGETASAETYYVKGIVSQVTNQYDTTYGDASFYISDNGSHENDFMASRTNYIGNQKYADGQRQIQVGDDVVVCGRLVNYRGNTPETNTGGYLVSMEEPELSTKYENPISVPNNAVVRAKATKQNMTDSDLAITSTGVEPYAVLNENNTVLTFFYDGKKNSRSGMDVESFINAEDRPWHAQRENITKVIFDSSFANCTSITSTLYWFQGCSSLNNVTGIENLKTDNVTNMTAMFYNCSSLAEIDLSKFNTANTINVTSLFAGCLALTNVKVTGINTANMKYMNSMFQDCSNLTSLDLSSFNTVNATGMSYMFSGCSALTTIYVGEEWSTTSVTESADMFAGCTSLEGGAGTTYDASHTDAAYARIDGGPNSQTPGYFTAKSTASNLEIFSVDKTVTYVPNQSITPTPSITMTPGNDAEWLTDLAIGLTNTTTGESDDPLQFTASIYYPNSTETFSYLDAMRGTLNPRDGDLTTNAETGAIDNTGTQYIPGYNNVPRSGGFIAYEALQDGSLIIPIRVTSNKSLFVVEDDGHVKTDIQFKDADGNTLTLLPSPLCAVSSEYVMGFLSFNVEQGRKYYVFCNGSKPRFAGYVFSTERITIDSETMKDVLDLLLPLTPQDVEVFAIDATTELMPNEPLQATRSVTMTPGNDSAWGVRLLEDNKHALKFTASSYYPGSTSSYTFWGGARGTNPAKDGDLTEGGNSGDAYDYTIKNTPKSGAYVTFEVSQSGSLIIPMHVPTNKPLYVIDSNGKVKTDIQFVDTLGQVVPMLAEPLCVFSETASTPGYLSFNVTPGGKYTIFITGGADLRYGGYVFSTESITIDPATTANVKSILEAEDDTHERTLWEGQQAIDWDAIWEDTDGSVSAQLKQCKVGTVLRLYVKRTADDYAQGCATVNWANISTGITVGENNPAPEIHEDTYVDFTLTEKSFELLEQGNLQVVGHGLDLLKITVGPGTIGPEPYAVLSNNNTVLTFFYDEKKAANNGMDVGPFDYGSKDKRGWTPYTSQITKAVFDQSFDQCMSLTSTAFWFMFMDKLETIENIQYLHTDNVESMACMFDSCYVLRDLDVSHFVTAKVKDMQCMFNRCESLTSLDLRNFDTSSCTFMRGMFYDCKGLTSLDITNFDTSKNTSTESMFEYCSGLTSLDLSHFSTENVTSMGWMFRGCSGLTSLDLSKFNTANVQQMNHMFNSCSSLTKLDLGKFNTANVRELQWMFAGCSGLTSLNVSSFNTSNVAYMIGIFQDCSALKTLNIRNFSTEGLASDSPYSMAQLFYGCSSLTELDLSNFNTSAISDMRFLFAGCSSLVNLDISNFNTANVNNFSSMFHDCSNLRTLNISSFNTANVTTMNYLFAGCTSLASIQAGNAAIPDSIYAQIGNPNLLLYVNEASLAPASVTNVVVNGAAENIVLTDVEQGNNNFYCPQEFTAHRISYTHNYRQATQVGVSRGWETIVLPFTVQTITHEKNGPLAPFGVDGGKPFWLRQLTENGLVSAQHIEANMPYLISMPNNGRYPADYNQAGNVTFSATNVVVPMTEQREMSGNNRMLIPTTMRVAQSPSVYAINRNASYENNPEGSIFVADYREVRPFEAYVEHTNGARFFTLSDLAEGDVTDIQAIHDIASADVVKVYNLSGVLLKTGKRQEVMSQLPKGIYIVNGVKVVVK